MQTVAERFLRYVVIDTQSDENSTTVPSTQSQIEFGKMLLEEVKELGIKDVHMSDHGYVYGSIPSNIDKEVPAIGFIAHMDTADTFKGPTETPRVIENYDGGKIVLESGVVLDPAEEFYLRRAKGCDLIVTNGHTLLGGDDKAGVAEIMTALERLMTEDHPHGKVAFAFTPDEEIGSGMEDFDIEAFGADFAYTLDGMGFGEMAWENFNGASAKVKIHGVSTHPGEATGKMVNASLVAMEYAMALPEKQRPENASGYEGFYHLLDMSGDCDHAQLHYIIREQDDTLFTQMKEFLFIVEKQLNEKYGEGTVKVTIKKDYDNMAKTIQPHMHLIDHAKKAIENLGGTPTTLLIRGGTDGASLSYMGIPCPDLATGSCNHHSVKEFANIQEMEKCSQLILEILKLYAEE